MNASLIEIIMGSQSDWEVMQEAKIVLEALELPFRARVVSGSKIIIAGAGGAAHLPGMVAALTHLPVIAVPVPSKHLQGLDSLLSIAQMPRGVAVATQAIGAAGAFNAGLLAAQILSLEDAELRKRLIAWREQQSANVAEEIT